MNAPPWLLRAGPVYARIALGAAFLSAVASRLGLWGVRSSGWEQFERYAGQVNSFLPASLHPLLARASTVCELFLGIALVIGRRQRWVALGAAALLALFGIAMSISFGVKEPLDFSVFPASACPLLLALGSGEPPDHRPRN